ncbi:MAG: thiamine pyrophosphate-dependent enzyme, partial [Actinomycetia bacterium]|nr:thiamine pyrophosphate-dependent enzyme [Actinomycetes bacterium]
HDMVRGVALLRPLFEFSMACSGCGETPYLKLLTQLWGDRLLVANATGCSSIFGGNLPTTPWAVDDSGRGPAWSNSLFEDNAEFGYGIALAQEHRRATARSLLAGVPGLDGDLVAAILDAGQGSEADVQAQRARIETLKQVLTSRDDDASRQALAAADDLVDKVVWIVGGDGWAYDIGFGGLDHVLASGADVNILVLDTQVYSNTGGQASKATPRGAMAAFAAGGKATRAKDLGAIARTYPGVYVAQVAIGADQQQSVRALLEAQAWRGPSLVIAYSTCIEHGIDMATSMSHQGTMVDDGAWPLYRRRPEGHPEAGLRLDSRPPTGDVRAFMAAETRFAALARTDPERAAAFAALAQDDADARLASLELEK